jgi:hypothetical protein
MGFARAKKDPNDAAGVGTELFLRASEPTRAGGGASGDAFDAVATALSRALGLESGPRSRPRPEEADSEASGLLRAQWAVDHGDAIRTLPTYSVWNELAKGTVSRRDRVWREGMECWRPIADVPELACALVDHPATIPPEADARSPEPPRVGPPTSTPAKRRRRAPPRELAWIAGGTAVGLLSVSLALATTTPAEPTASLHTPAPWAATVARSADAALAAPAAIGAAPLPAPTALPLSADARARLHADPGQHRARARRP